uniref:Uncharacterized protein n=1 Tax=Ornithodoros erraticus TaxID=265619 RepID=A0A293M0T7_ORNER
MIRIQQKRQCHSIRYAVTSSLPEYTLHTTKKHDIVHLPFANSLLLAGDLRSCHSCLWTWVSLVFTKRPRNVCALIYTNEGVLNNVWASALCIRDPSRPWAWVVKLPPSLVACAMHIAVQ